MVRTLDTYWLEGRLKKQLLKYTDVTEKDFEKYVAPTAQMQYVKPYNYKENKIGEDNWTEETSLGGSDCVQIMHEDWLELWLVKTGRKEPEDLSEILPVQLGSFTEEFNLDWFSKQQFKLRSNSQAIQSRKNNRRCSCQGTVDAVFNGHVVEAKAHKSFLQNVRCYQPIHATTTNVLLFIW